MEANVEAQGRRVPTRYRYFWFHVKADILAPLSFPMEVYDINLTGTVQDSSHVEGYIGIYIRYQ